jgi:hypothetical protein
VTMLSTPPSFIKPRPANSIASRTRSTVRRGGRPDVAA